MVIPITRITLFRKSQLTKYFGYSSHQLCLHFTHSHLPVQNNSQNEDLPFTIKWDSKVGYQWIATRPLRTGMILLDEMPAWTGPRWAGQDETTRLQSGLDQMPSWMARQMFPDEHNESSSICVTCGDDPQPKPNKWTEFWRDKKCLNCGWPVCGSDCEKSSIHADNECQIFKTHGIHYPPNEFKMSEVGSFIGLLRGVNMKNTMPTVYEELMKLQDKLSLPHLQEKHNEITKVQVDSLERFLKKRLDNRDEYEKFHRLCFINSFNNDGGSNKCGQTLLYPKISRINHSCSPNCSHDIGPGPSFQMRVRAAVNIKEGTELTICYDSTNFLEGTLERQKNFRSVGGLGFVCGCSRCLDPTENESMMSGITCQTCLEENKSKGITDPNKFGYFLPKDPQCIDDNAEWKCSGCGDKVPASTLLPIVDELNESIEKQEKDDDYAFHSFLKKFKDGHVLHPNHYVIQKAVSRLTQIGDKISKLNEDQAERQFQLYMYQLEIMDKIAPGCKIEQGNLLMNAISAIFVKMILRNKRGVTNFEEEMKLCINLETQSRLCFRNALNYVLDGKERSYSEDIDKIALRRRQLENVFKTEFRKLIRIEN